MKTNISNKTKKVAMLLCVVWFVGGQVFATNVSGIISTNTVWTLVNSPYIVTGSILVNSGVKLTIESGVAIKFNSGKSMYINGTIIARGTEKANIFFTSNQPTRTAGDWGNIIFSASSTAANYDTKGNYVDGSLLEYCVIEYAGAATKGAVEIYDAYPLINHCSIQINNASGVYTSYTVFASKELKIINNKIMENTSDFGGGIYTSFGGYYGGLSISKNIIKNNTARSYGGGMYCYYARPKIYDNYILNNKASIGSGIYAETYSSPNIYNNIISNNSASFKAGGIYLNYLAGGWNAESHLLSNNSILSNNATNEPAIYYNYNGLYYIEHNTLIDNAQLTSTSGTSAITVTSSIIDPVINYNNISNNTTYELWNSNTVGSNNIDANYNWWGSSVDSEIQTKLYDWFDNGSLGIINSSKFLITPDTIAPISPPKNAIKIDINNGQVKLIWDKNPEADIAGYRVCWGGFTGYSFTNYKDVGMDTSFILSGVSYTDTIGIVAYDNTFSPVIEDISTIVNENIVNGNESWYAFAKPICNSLKLVMSSTNASCSTCNNGTATANVTGGITPYSYSWKTSPMQTDSKLTGLLPKTYTVTITDHNGCSLTDSVSVSFLSYIDENNISLINIYPNPATERLFILSNNNTVEYSIYNTVGELVSEGKAINNMIKISDLSKGYYYTLLKIGNQTKVMKFIKN